MEEQQAKSKSQVKRELAELGDLARELVAEKVIDLADLPIPDDVSEAVLLGRRCKRTALKRQLKHIASMLGRIDDEAIRETLARLRQPHLQQVENEHRLNAWRERLISGDKEIMAELLERYPDFAIQHMNQLVRNVKKEIKLDKPPKYFLQIYQYLRSLEPAENAIEDNARGD